MLWKTVKLKFRWILPKQAHEWFWIFLLCGHGGVLQVLTCMRDKDWNDEDVYWLLCRRLHVHSYHIRSHITLSQLGSMSQASHWEHRVSRILSRVSRILSRVSRTMHCLRFHVYLSRISLTFRSHITLHDCVTRFTPCPSRLPIHTCVSRTTNSILHTPNNFKTASHYFNRIAKHFQWNKFLPQKNYSNYWSNETARKSSRSNKKENQKMSLII